MLMKQCISSLQTKQKQTSFFTKFTDKTLCNLKGISNTDAYVHFTFRLFLYFALQAFEVVSLLLSNFLRSIQGFLSASLHLQALSAVLFFYQQTNNKLMK